MFMVNMEILGISQVMAAQLGQRAGVASRSPCWRWLARALRPQRPGRRNLDKHQQSLSEEPACGDLMVI